MNVPDRTTTETKRARRSRRVLSLEMRSLSLYLAAVVVLGLPGALRAGTLYQDQLFGVKTIGNVVYGTGLVNGGASSKNLLLNVYEPVDIGVPVPANRPTILFIHGGGFVRGSKNNFSEAAVWASHGYNVISIDYRLQRDNPPVTPGPASGYPFGALDNVINADIQDVKTAMAWINANADNYGIDTRRIGIGGVSAGAILSQLAAYVTPPPQGAPKVVLDLLGGMYGDVTAVHAGDPPALVVHGTIDHTLPFSGDQAFVNQLNRSGIFNQFFVEQGIGHHVDWNLAYHGETLSQCTIGFLSKELAGVAVPEPSTIALGVIGAAALTIVARRPRKQSRRS